ncbi:DNA polymerase III PolC, partial [Lacticaseibacillus rhamnosus MTCC 5462]
MALSQHEMFEKLMDQLDLPADVRHDPSLADGSVQAVTIHEQSQRYDFTLAFPTILPFQILIPSSRNCQLRSNKLRRRG